MNDLEEQIKALIIDCLSLEDVSIDDISSEQALFAEGLGLDSIDALEIGIAVSKKFGTTLDPNDENVQQHFATVKNLAAFVARDLQQKEIHGSE